MCATLRLNVAPRPQSLSLTLLVVDGVDEAELRGGPSRRPASHPARIEHWGRPRSPPGIPLVDVSR